MPPDPPVGGMGPPDPTDRVPPSALLHVEECTYFWGVNTSWGINMAKSKRPLNQEDNQAPQPTMPSQNFMRLSSATSKPDK